MLQPAAKALWEKSLLPWVCGLLEKSVLTQVHIYSVPTGLWVAEHGADCEHFGQCLPAPEWGPGNESCQVLVAMGLWADILLLHAAVLRESHSTWPQEGPVVILDA